ncbi:MAG: glycosyltransferase family 2 protein [Acidobacteria bacterium]|nr:glycosyltransferase family 2 protein [Acidobacteriota bacterium]
MNAGKNYNQPEVFVLVPSYNHAPFVEKCLKSIIKQTFSPKKLLVIDDGSQDGSPQTIEKVLNDCPFIDEHDQIIDCTSNWTSFSDGDMLPLLLRGIIFSSSSVVYRRSALEKHSWNENSLLEDYELYLRLCADGEFAFDESVLCAWRQHGWNVSGDAPLMLEEWISAQNRVADKLNISREELDKVQTELKFDAVLNYIRSGRQREAAKLFLENISGAKSVSQIGKTMFRLSIPQTLFKWNRQRKKREAIKSYGKLEI